MTGKLIVIYGGNNSGKTTQAKLLVDWLKKEGKKVTYLKYPIYDSPTGKRINGILREGKEKNISETEFQELYYQNRKEYEPHLKKINSDLIQEDVAILLDGARFSDGKEKGHIHEENDALMETVRLRNQKI